VAPGASIAFGQGNKGWVGDVPRFEYSTAKIQNLGWKPALDSLGAIRLAVRQIAEQENAI
jgi:UDP-glucose 4-epimerase